MSNFVEAIAHMTLFLAFAVIFYYAFMVIDTEINYRNTLKVLKAIEKCMEDCMRKNNSEKIDKLLKVANRCTYSKAWSIRAIIDDEEMYKILKPYLKGVK